MQQRRSSAGGRPSGTDGSDYSYRMVVDSRYTRVAKYKSLLSGLLFVQGLILLAGVLLKALPFIKGEDPNVLGLSSVLLSFLSLVIGDSGRRRSRSSFLKIYLILSFVAICLSIASALKSNILLKVLQSGLANSWEAERVQLIEVAHIFSVPFRLQEQMLAHICLKYRTDTVGLQQQEILDSLPQAIRSSISVHLFYSLVDKVYLFHGVSSDLLFQLVSEMKAEFFSPNEDVILQNEAPTDFYVIINGSADLLQSKNGVEQVVGQVKKGDICGEIAVLCYRPQLFTHLKDEKNEVPKESLVEIENMIDRGMVDLPLSLCFAAIRGDDQLMLKQLKRGLDPNESEDTGRTALHIAASNGNEKCVHLLLDYGADPNSRDQEGSTPLWEAMRGGHEPVVKMLRDYDANIQAGDVALYACAATEQNNIKLLKKIARFGGNVTLPAPKYNGGTALHVAVTHGNLEIVKYLLEQGADIDIPDNQGFSARDLTEQQDQEHISAFFQSMVGPKNQTMVTIQENDQNKVLFLGRWFTSEPSLPHLPRGNRTLSWDGSIGSSSRLRRKANNFRNSIFGILSNAQVGKNDLFPSVDQSNYPRQVAVNRVIISGSQEGTLVKKVIALPNSFEELLEIVANKFVFYPTRIQTECGAEIDCIEVIRDADRLFLIKDHL